MKTIPISKLKSVICGLYYDILQIGICRLYGSLFLYMLLDEENGIYAVKRATKKEIKQAKKRNGFNSAFNEYIIRKLS